MTQDPTLTPDPAPLKATDLHHAFQLLKEENPKLDLSELEYYVGLSPTLSADEIRAKIGTVIEILDESENGFANIAKNKLKLTLKNI